MQTLATRATEDDEDPDAAAQRRLAKGNTAIANDNEFADLDDLDPPGDGGGSGDGGGDVEEGDDRDEPGNEEEAPPALGEEGEEQDEVDADKESGEDGEDEGDASTASMTPESAEEAAQKRLAHENTAIQNDNEFANLDDL